MNTPLAEFDRWWLAPRDGEPLEFKQTKNHFDVARMFQQCVAIVREGGGKLVPSISDQAPRKVVGRRALPVPDDLQAKILDKF